MFEVLSPFSVPAREHQVQEARHACAVFRSNSTCRDAKATTHRHRRRHVPSGSDLSTRPKRQQPIGIADGMSRAVMPNRHRRRHVPSGNDPSASPTACPERQQPIAYDPTRMAGISHVYTRALFFFYFDFISCIIDACSIDMPSYARMCVHFGMRMHK